MNNVWISGPKIFSLWICVCSHYLQWTLLPPIQLQLSLTAMEAISWTCEECLNFFLYWKISFISLIFTFTVVITHRSNYVVETVNVFSLKAEESIRKIIFSCTTIKKMLDFFGECKYLFRHIKVTMNLICYSRLLLISKDENSSLLFF